MENKRTAPTRQARHDYIITANLKDGTVRTEAVNSTTYYMALQVGQRRLAKAGVFLRDCTSMTVDDA